MNKISKHLLILILSLSWPAWSQIARLVNISLEGDKEKAVLTLEFDDVAPEYEVTSNVENDITTMKYSILQGSVSEKFDVDVVRPVQHVQVISPNESSERKLEINVYLEQNIGIKHESVENSIVSEFAWTALEAEETPSHLISLSYISSEENSLSTKLELDNLPKDAFIFATENQQQFIAVIHNVISEEPSLKGPTSRLITRFKKKTGESITGVPYLKLVYSSNQELLMDVAKEENQIFIDFYGVGVVTQETAPQEAATVTKEVEPLEYGEEIPAKEKASYDEEKGGGAKWLYLTLGTGVLVGGGVAAYYLYFLDDGPGGDNPPPTIPTPDESITFPDDPE